MEKGFTLWFTGLSGSGKSTIANAITPKLQSLGKRVEILDGDEVRTNLSKGLGSAKKTETRTFAVLAMWRSC
jgi:adenylylsulfate kinase-like enzyme